LPEYKGLAVKKEARKVTDEDVEKAIDALRQQQLSFKTVERPCRPVISPSSITRAPAMATRHGYRADRQGSDRTEGFLG